MKNKWIEIRGEGLVGTKDDIIQALIDAGSPGVLECAPDKAKNTGKAARQGLKAYLPGDYSGTDPKIKALKNTFKALKWTLALEDFEEEDWISKWKEVIHPVSIAQSETGTKIIIKATWHKIRAETTGGKNIIINIDPSMAFGTGSHPSTRMCLRAISYITQSEDGNGGYGPIKSLLDVGTGTGILSIAAKKLNIARTVGIDIDPLSIKIAKENARLNKVKCTFKEASTMSSIKGLFDMVVANIISSELIKLREPINGTVKPGGFAVLSGILSEEARDVEAAYRGIGFMPYMRYAESTMDQGGGSWVALVLRKAY